MSYCHGRNPLGKSQSESQSGIRMEISHTMVYSLKYELVRRCSLSGLRTPSVQQDVPPVPGSPTPSNPREPQVPLTQHHQPLVIEGLSLSFQSMANHTLLILAVTPY